MSSDAVWTWESLLSEPSKTPGARLVNADYSCSFHRVGSCGGFGGVLTRDHRRRGRLGPRVDLL